MWCGLLLCLACAWFHVVVLFFLVVVVESALLVQHQVVGCLEWCVFGLGFGFCCLLVVELSQSVQKQIGFKARFLFFV